MVPRWAGWYRTDGGEQTEADRRVVELSGRLTALEGKVRQLDNYTMAQVRVEIIAVDEQRSESFEEARESAAGVVVKRYRRFASPRIGSKDEIVCVETDCYDPEIGGTVWSILNDWRFDAGKLSVLEAVTETGSGVRTTKSPLNGVTQLRITFRGNP